MLVAIASFIYAHICPYHIASHHNIVAVQEGDSFVCSFHDGPDGVHFCLKVRNLCLKVRNLRHRGVFAHIFPLARESLFLILRGRIGRDAGHQCVSLQFFLPCQRVAEYGYGCAAVCHARVCLRVSVRLLCVSVLCIRVSTLSVVMQARTTTLMHLNINRNGNV